MPVNLGKTIYTAVSRGYPLDLAGKSLLRNGEKFSISNPYVIEVLADKPEVYNSLSKLEGKKLSTVCRIIDNPQCNEILARYNRLCAQGSNILPSRPNLRVKKLYKKGLEDAVKLARAHGSEDMLAKARGFESYLKNNTIETLSDKDLYYRYMEFVYKELRTTDYGMKFLRTQNIADFTGKANSLVRVKHQNGWHYRMPVNRTSKDVVDRVSVNAIADKDLIADLDKLLGSGTVKGYYKTPDLSADWLSRHDPITIYLDEKATPEILQKIQQTCSKYIRSSEPVLPGQRFAPGLALQKSPTQNDIEILLGKLKNIDPQLEEAGRSYLTNISGKLNASAGQMYALEKVLSDLS